MYEGSQLRSAGTQVPQIAKCPIETIPEVIKSLQELAGALFTTSRNIADALGGSQPETSNNGCSVTDSLAAELRQIRETLREALSQSDRARGILSV